MLLRDRTKPGLEIDRLRTLASVQETVELLTRLRMVVGDRYGLGAYVRKEIGEIWRVTFPRDPFEFAEADCDNLGGALSNL